MMLSNKSKVVYLAWSKKDWIQLARIIPDTNRNKVKEIMLDFQKTILPKTKANIRLTRTGKAYWENITDVESQKIETARIIWGFKKEKLTWTREHELLALRTGLRLWKYKADSLLINIIVERAKARKKWLLEQLNMLHANKVWEKVPLDSTTPSNVIDTIQNYSLNNAEQAVLKRWYPIAQELAWKTKQTEIIKRWLDKNPHIPTNVGMKWVEAWA